MSVKDYVVCPACKREIPLSAMGALDVNGDPVMTLHKSENKLIICIGSDRSIQATRKLLKNGGAK